MKALARVISVLSVTTLTVCCGAWLFFGVSATGWKALAIPTGSMTPYIPKGSLVFVHRVPTSSLKIGDVITYTNPRDKNMTISHRIIKEYMIGGVVPGFETKGDANKIPDVPIPAGVIKGKVAWHLPKAGYVLLDAKKPLIILPLVYLAALLIMIEEVQRLAEYYRRWIVYRLPGYRREPEVDHTVAKRVSLGGALTTAFVVIGLAVSPAALAALKSNTVVLAHNRLSVAKVNCGNSDHDKDNGNCKDNDGKCDGDNDADDKNCNKQCKSNQSNNVTVNNNTTQNATTGNAHSSGGGSATSGNASNSNNTNININTSNNSSC